MSSKRVGKSKAPGLDGMPLLSSLDSVKLLKMENAIETLTERLGEVLVMTKDQLENFGARMEQHRKEKEEQSKIKADDE